MSKLRRLAVREDLSFPFLFKQIKFSLQWLRYIHNGYRFEEYIEASQKLDEIITSVVGKDRYYNYSNLKESEGYESSEFLSFPFLFKQVKFSLQSLSDIFTMYMNIFEECQSFSNGRLLAVREDYRHYNYSNLKKSGEQWIFFFFFFIRTSRIFVTMTLRYIHNVRMSFEEYMEVSQMDDPWLLEKIIDIIIILI